MASSLPATCLLCKQVAEDYGFQRVMTTEELDLALPHAAPFSVATTSGVRTGGTHSTLLSCHRADLLYQVSHRVSRCTARGLSHAPGFHSAPLLRCAQDDPPYTLLAKTCKLVRRAAGNRTAAASRPSRQRGESLRRGAGAEGSLRLVPRLAAHPGRRAVK